MEIVLVKLFFELDSPLKKNAANKIRGYLASLLWDDPLAHQHGSNGYPIYRYPRVQYKIINDSFLLIAFNEGVKTAEKIFHDIETINIDGSWKEILLKALENYEARFEITNQPISYTFLTPWLALNEKNYEQYMKFGTWSERRELLENILIGNILSVSKSLGYTVAEPIKAEIGKMREVKTRLKDVPMIGFLGTFSVNFEIPDYWGIGKSVSRGFGTLIKCNSL